MISSSRNAISFYGVKSVKVGQEVQRGLDLRPRRPIGLAVMRLDKESVRYSPHSRTVPWLAFQQQAVVEGQRQMHQVDWQSVQAEEVARQVQPPLE